MAEKPSKQTLARRRNAKEHRAAVLRGGGRRVDLVLDPESAEALVALERARGETATTVIRQLVLQAAESIR